MEILQLKYFKTVARMEHMTRAANKLNISQPALSKMITRLEEELGVPLFDREGRNIRLNVYGEKFLQRVDNVFNELKDGTREIKDLANMLENSVSVAIVLPHVLPIFLENFLSQFPNVRIKQFSSSTGKTIKQLENNEIDLCISTTLLYGENIEWEFIKDEPIYLSVPINHKFAARDFIDLSEARNETFIGYTPKFHFRQLTDTFCEQAGFNVNTKIELEESCAILSLVEKGFGIAFAPKLPLLNESFPKVIQIPIRNPHCYQKIGIAWNKNHYLSNAALQFKKFVIHFFNHEMEKYYSFQR